MKKMTQSFSLKEEIKYPEIFLQYSRDNDLYMTIETTGLSPERHRIVSVSFAAVSEDTMDITTFFSDNKDDELTILESAQDMIDKAGRVITWNGDSFDFRFLSKRGEEYGKKMWTDASHDLRKVYSPLKRFFLSDSLSLYTLLNEMGIRDDSIPDGKTLVTLYQTFIGTGDEKYSAPIEKHSIFKLIGIMNLQALNNCLRINKVSPVINEISDTDDAVIVNGSTDIFFPIGMKLRLSGVEINFLRDTFTGTFATDNGRIRMYFPDPSSYVRLKSDGSLIPKELAKSMSKNDYESVTKENCFSLVKLPVEDSRRKKQLESYIRSLVKM